MILTVHVKPRAKEDKLEWVDENTVKVWVRAIPEKGQANQAVLRLLAVHFNLSPSLIRLVRGTTTRIKQFDVHLGTGS